MKGATPWDEEIAKATHPDAGLHLMRLLNRREGYRQGVTDSEARYKGLVEACKRWDDLWAMWPSGPVKFINIMVAL